MENRSIVIARSTGKIEENRTIVIARSDGKIEGVRDRERHRE